MSDTLRRGSRWPREKRRVRRELACAPRDVSGTRGLTYRGAYHAAIRSPWWRRALAKLGRREARLAVAESAEARQ